MHDILENENPATTPPVEQPTPPQEPVKETMQVDPDLIRRLLDQNDALQKKLDEQAADFKRDIDILRESVSRGKLEEAEGKRKPAEKPRAFLGRYDGKVVVGWKAEKNEYVYNPLNPNNVAGEVLQTRLFYLDGSDSGPIPQVMFTRNDDRVFVRKVGEKRNEEGQLVSWVLEFEDTSIEPRQIEIHPQFINPV